jgi:AcrR family transcriptional regulator
LLKISLEERKDYIAKNACKVFSQNSYQTASLRDISREAKISKAGMYHYFKSKEEILAHILIKNSYLFLEKLKNIIKESKEKGLSPQDSFKKLMETYAQHVNSDKDERLIVLRERHQLTGRYKEELFKKEQAMFRLIKNELQKIHNLGKKIDLNVIAFLFISMSHWVGYWFKEGKKLSLEAIINQNIWVIFHGILKR